MTSPNLSHLVFIGTYTHSTSEGIYVHRFDPDTGALEPVSVATGADNPSFLALHPSGRFHLRHVGGGGVRGGSRKGRCTPTPWTPSRAS